VARGAILGHDLTLQPCYIARDGDHFAHGATAHDALAEARDKATASLPIEDRLARFRAEFAPDVSHPAQALFDAHGWLTGSCTLGRQEFCRSRGIDLANDSYTVAEFIALTINQYGGEIIAQLKETYNV
jgi:hypothetical protein